MHTNELTITADLSDNDGTVGLTSQLKAREFQGLGTGWFNISEVLRFCDTLEAITNSMSGHAELIGGLGDPETNEFLTCLGFRCYVIAQNGILGMQVSLADQPHTDCRPEEIFKLTAELKVEVQSMTAFIGSLRHLCQGNTNSSTLLGRPSY